MLDAIGATPARAASSSTSARSPRARSRRSSAEAVLGELWRRRERAQPGADRDRRGPQRLPGTARGSADRARDRARRPDRRARAASSASTCSSSTQRPQKVHENVVSQCDNLAADADELGRRHRLRAEVFSFVPPSLLGGARRSGSASRSWPGRSRRIRRSSASARAARPGRRRRRARRLVAPGQAGRAELDDLVHAVEPLGPVRDQQHGLASAASSTSPSAPRPSRVEVRRRLVEQQHRRVGEQGAREHDSRWRWPPERRDPSSPTCVSSPSGLRGDPVADPRAVERGSQLVVGGVRPCEQQVRADRRVEEVRVLAGERERAADVLLAVLAHVAAGDRDAALLRVEEAQQQVRRRSSCPRRSGRRARRGGPARA